MHPRVKICCISSLEEAEQAVQAGASALGLVAEMPSGPGVISEPLIKQITAKVPPGVSSFLLTSETDADAIIAQHKRVNTSTIQIVDELASGSYQHIKASLPGIKLVQVIHVRDKTSIEEALGVASQVDALLLDSGNPNLSIKELGGTGRTHNWEISKEIVQGSPVPVYLAGGLNESNVQEAIRKVKPFGLDLCSGVRTEGNLDPKKLSSFFSAVRGA